MTHTYSIQGMTCNGCRQKVLGLLLKVPGVTNAHVDLATATATIDMPVHIPTKTLQEGLKDHPKYSLSEMAPASPPEETKSWLATYKPILLIFGYVTAIALISSNNNGTFHWMHAMRIFMSGFFLTFSFFKLLDLQGFADSYAMYDIMAKRFNGWGHLYPFMELALGISFAINFQPLLTNSITFMVMGISLVGVIQSVLNKRKIKCACLGAVFNLPMSMITIIEDTLMIVMSAITISMFL